MRSYLLLITLLHLLPSALLPAQEPSWEPIALPPSTEMREMGHSMRRPQLWIFPTANGDIFATGGMRNLYRSTDGGRNWNRVGSGLAGRYARVIDGRSGELYALTDVALFRSDDRGDTWRPLYSGGVSDLAALSDGDLLAITQQRGLILLRHGASAWTIFDTTERRRGGDREGAPLYHSLALDSSNVVYLLRSTGYSAGRSTVILRTADKGAHWDTLATPASRAQPTELQANERGDLFLTSRDSVWRSGDRGATWRALPVGVRNEESRLLVGTGGMIYREYQRSTDNGESWALPFKGRREPTAEEMRIPAGAVALDAAGRVYMFSLDGNLFRGAPVRPVRSTPTMRPSAYLFERSLTWTRITTPAWEKSFGAAAFSTPLQILFLGRDGAIFAGGPHAGLQRSTDGGKSWITVRERSRYGDSDSGNVPVASALYADGKIFAVASGRGIYRSGDDGAHWEKVLENRSLLGLLRGPAGAITAYGVDSLARTTDGGATWSVHGVPKRRSSLMPAIDSNGVIYSAASDSREGRVHMVRSSDGGATWSDRVLPSYITEPFLHAGPGGKLYALTLEGDFLSTDGGESWGVMPPSGRMGLARSMTLGDGGAMIAASYWGMPYMREGIGGITISHDGGVTWRRSAQGFGAREVPVAIAPDDAGRLYVATNAGAIYRSEGTILDTAAFEGEEMGESGWRAPGFDSAALRKGLRFPAKGKSELMGGRGYLVALVDASGKPSNVEAYGLDDEYRKIMMAAARSIRFTPGMREGVPVAGWVTAVVTFGGDGEEYEGHTRRRVEWDSTMITVRADQTGVGLWMKPGALPPPMVANPSGSDFNTPDRFQFITLDTEPTWDSLEVARNIRYPREAILQQLQGTVFVTALIDPDGKARSVWARERAQWLDSAAVDAVRRTSFRPATYKGKPFQALVTVPVRFILPKPGPSSNATVDTAALRKILVYPSAQLKKKVEGHVEIVLKIDTLGVVTTRFERASEAFKAPVLKALDRVRKTPALRYGIPMEDSLLLMVDFTPPGAAGRSEAWIAIHLSSSFMNGTGLGFDPDMMVPMNGNREPSVIAKEPEAEPDPDEFIAIESEPTYDPAELRRNTVYPEVARRNGIEGTVVVNALVGKDGHVMKTQIQRSENKVLDQAAIDAVMRTRFKPAMQNGNAVAVWMMIPVKFKVE